MESSWAPEGTPSSVFATTCAELARIVGTTEAAVTTEPDPMEPARQAR